MNKRILVEVSVDQIERGLKLRRAIYRALFELTAPNANGVRVCEVVDLSKMFDNAIQRVRELGLLEGRFEGDQWNVFEKMRKAGWINYSRGRTRREDGKKVYWVYLIRSPDEIDLEIDDTIRDAESNVVSVSPVQIQTDELQRALKCLMTASIQYGEERFVVHPDKILRCFFGPNHDVDATIGRLIDAGLAEWRDMAHGPVTSERLFLYQSKP